QITGVCPADEFADRVVKRGFIGDRGLVNGVISAVVDCLQEELLEGRRVYVGDLGSFQCVINGTGADSAEEFSVADNIRGLTVRWEPSKYFENLHSRAKYKRVARRSTQKRERRESNRELQAKLDALRQKPQGEEQE
ncbi:MAG: hypothetical protein LUB62_01365, partial [Prevotellaceae bacterium]|nr:hypothetical protein [Prevotellaceae bacterium]